MVQQGRHFACINWHRDREGCPGWGPVDSAKSRSRVREGGECPSRCRIFRLPRSLREAPPPQQPPRAPVSEGSDGGLGWAGLREERAAAGGEGAAGVATTAGGVRPPPADEAGAPFGVEFGHSAWTWYGSGVEKDGDGGGAGQQELGAWGEEQEASEEFARTCFVAAGRRARARSCSSVRRWSTLAHGLSRGA